VKQEILSGAVDGEFLTEDEVAATLGVSRTPVREAFLRLHADALLTLVPHKGAFVRPITERDVTEVMEARSLIETFGVERILALPAVDKARIVETLTEMVAEQRAAAQRDAPDATAFIDSDRRFHLEIIAAADNGVLVDLFHRLRDRQMRLGVGAVSRNTARLAQILDEHQVILERISIGDPAMARQAVIDHLDLSAEALRMHVRRR
jgi:DNA-binding GntR family transcriptional regulator